MHQHFRRYCFHLAEKLGMSVQNILSTMSSSEISEWMAYDLTCSDEWSKNYERNLEREKSKQLSKEQTLAAFKAMLSGNVG